MASIYDNNDNAHLAKIDRYIYASMCIINWSSLFERQPISAASVDASNGKVNAPRACELNTAVRVTFRLSSPEMCVCNDAHASTT